MTLNKQYVIFAIFNLAFLVVAVALFAHPYNAEGSVLVGNDYTATTTAANSLYGATITTGRKIKTGNGSLGQITITGANTGVVNIYDATTTDVTQRAPSMSTSSILLASFPASAAAGTYTFDAQFKVGLYIDLVSGNMPTSTVLYR